MGSKRLGLYHAVGTAHCDGCNEHRRDVLRYMVNDTKTRKVLEEVRLCPGCRFTFIKKVFDDNNIALWRERGGRYVISE